MIDVLPVRPGQRIILSFQDVNSPWRQGVWIGTDGTLTTNGIESPHCVIWHDTAPGLVVIDILETDGFLRVYNIWNSWRDIAEHESQTETSGMIIDDLGGGGRRYHCNDIGYENKFDKVVFTIQTAPIDARSETRSADP